MTVWLFVTTVRAHPRSRGENEHYGKPDLMGAGSSPLTRGKPPRQVHASTLQGLIPAHAGKTVHRRCTTLNVSAHPRSRGENRGLAAVTRSPSGSSPLTRGKLLPRSGSRTPKRLIPAHAGKTHKASARLTRVRAHPRSRGENFFALPSQRFSLGSSPLTRGKLGLSVSFGLLCRLIPAHAGKTLCVTLTALVSTAHPRSRGENSLILGTRVKKEGSSPLTRGKRVSFSSQSRSVGLIPAHAGKTWLRHRRVCAYAGSSPLTRGKRLAAKKGISRARLIPAHAGKTLTPTEWVTKLKAHPRSRGENRAQPQLIQCDLGSSPLTRGKPSAPASSPR